MPVTNYIDKKNKIIITSWHGEPSDSDLIDALNIYLRDIKSKPELNDYNELVNFGDSQGFKLTANALIELGRIASKSDKPGNNKLAIVVSSPLAYGLARMYEVHRNFNPQSTKKVLVFKSEIEAKTWLEPQEEPKTDSEDFFVQNNGSE
ncbi:STAS/SEC14 domain-containing protein [Thermodesulfobacteriota bacterium]